MNDELQKATNEMEQEFIKILMNEKGLSHQDALSCVTHFHMQAVNVAKSYLKTTDLGVELTENIIERAKLYLNG